MTAEAIETASLFDDGRRRWTVLVDVAGRRETVMVEHDQESDGWWFGLNADTVLSDDDDLGSDVIREAIHAIREQVLHP